MRRIHVLLAVVAVVVFSLAIAILFTPDRTADAQGPFGGGFPTTVAVSGVQNNGTAMPPRSYINFVNATLADDGPNNRTTVTGGSVANVSAPLTGNGSAATPLGLSTPLSVSYGGTGDATLVAHDVLLGEGTAGVGGVGPCGVGAVVYGQGALADPVCSTTTWPNAATTGDILSATGANAIGRIADVATGSLLASAGVGVLPAYTASPTITGTLTCATVTQTSTQAANVVYAGPGSGVAAAPTFRALVSADIPSREFVFSGFWSTGSGNINAISSAAIVVASTLNSMTMTTMVAGTGASNVTMRLCSDGSTCAGGNAYGNCVLGCAAAAGSAATCTVTISAVPASTTLTWSASTPCTANPTANMAAVFTTP